MMNDKLVKLKDISLILAGNSAPQDKTYFVNGKYPFIRTSDIGKDKISRSLIQVRDYLNEKGILGLKLFKKGTILLPKSGASTFLNHRAIMGIDAYVSSHLAGVVPNTSLVDGVYLYYYLQRIKAQSLIQDHKYPSLNLSVIADIEIFVPELMEQKRIVKILDEVFADIEKAKINAEKNLQNTKELFESYLQNIFSNPGDLWVKRSLKEVSIDFGRGRSRHRPRNDKSLYGGEYPFIQTGDIRKAKHFIIEYSQTYNNKGLSQSKLWPKGTVCITIAANIAETGILSFDACFPDSVIGVVVNPALVNVIFLEYLLQFYKSKLQAQGKGSAQKNINLTTFEFQKFSFPSVNEQKSIATRLDALSAEVEKLESIYKQKITLLGELKESVLEKAFTGDL